MQNYLTPLDYALLPIYLGLIYAVAYFIRNKLYPTRHPLRKYFIPGLTVKILGAIAISLVYAYYYKTGDTFNYFHDALIINSSLADSFPTWWTMMVHGSSTENPFIYPYVSQLYFYHDPASHTVSRTAALFSLFTFNTYLPAAVLFAAVSFTGVWALYKTFCRIKPSLDKYLAVCFLFVPSVCLWGSGIFKDTLCLFGLGWMTYASVHAFIFKEKVIRNVIVFLLSLLLVFTVKAYIVVAFIPGLLFWILFAQTKKIIIPALRFFTNLLIIVVGLGGLLLLAAGFEKELGKYSVDKIVTTAEGTRGWIYYSSGDEGSRYDLGEIEPGLLGMLKKAPAAINVSLFRPYLWESRKIIIFFSALESFGFLLLTLYVLWKIGIRRFFALLFTDPHIRFCILFSLIFFFGVGISSFNFGTLSRYKIPGVPFYAAGLVMILFSKTKPQVLHQELQRRLYKKVAA